MEQEKGHENEPVTEPVVQEHIERTWLTRDLKKICRSAYAGYRAAVRQAGVQFTELAWSDYLASIVDGAITIIGGREENVLEKDALDKFKSAHPQLQPGFNSGLEHGLIAYISYTVGRREDAAEWEFLLDTDWMRRYCGEIMNFIGSACEKETSAKLEPTAVDRMLSSLLENKKEWFISHSRAPTPLQWAGYVRAAIIEAAVLDKFKADNEYNQLAFDGQLESRLSGFKEFFYANLGELDQRYVKRFATDALLSKYVLEREQ